jgi:hypothetical protein
MASYLQQVRYAEKLCERLMVTSYSELPPPTEQRPIAQLAHGLDRVLFKYV